jgi:hypothetical protein
MSVNRKCRDFEALQAGQDQYTVNQETFGNLRAPDEIELIRMSDRYGKVHMVPDDFDHRAP